MVNAVYVLVLAAGTHPIGFSSDTILVVLKRSQMGWAALTPS